MRANEFITEAFNQPYSMQWEKGEHGDYDALVKLPDGTNLSIMFNNEGNDEWQVEFYRNNSQEVTGEGDAQRIFATVLTAIQQFIKQEQPWRLIFSASKDVEPGQNSESRAKLYNSLVARYARAWGYDEYNEDQGDQVTYELTRLKQDVAEDEINDAPTIGINVRSDSDIDYASLIVDGIKKYESRRTDSLRPYVGKKVGIVRTGSGPAVAIGQVTIGEPIIVDAEKFNKLRKQHLVPQGSKFDIDVDGIKYLYPMINPVRWDNEKLIKHRGIVSRKITELYEPKTSFPLNWYPSHDPSEASARAYDRNKGYIDIKFTPILDSDDMVEVEFSRNDSYDMTGGGDANRVLGTVLQAFREYLQGYQPKILLFSAKGSSRSKVYQNLIKRFASTVGYKQFDISKLSPETQEKIAFSGSDLMVLRKTINELNHAPAIDEMAGEIHGGVRKALADQGYKYLGSGIDKQAYLEPSTGQVLIVFGYRKNIDDFSPDQRMFIDWIKYCNANKNNPNLPKFSGFESFQFRGKNYIQARMEPLRETSDQVRYLVKQIDDVVDTMKKQNFKKQVKTISDYATFDSTDAGEGVYEIEDVLDYLGGEQAAMNLLQTVYQVKKFGLAHGFSIDLHSGNYMQRNDGTIVVNDPFVLWLRSK